MLWALIRNRTNAISFRRYQDVHRRRDVPGLDVRNPCGAGAASPNFTGTQAYEVLKQATDAFLMQECGVVDADRRPASPRWASWTRA